MSYGDKIFKWLDELPPGAKVKLDYTQPHTVRLVELVKEYITNHEYGNGIVFNADYTVIKKQRLHNLFNEEP